MKYEDISRKLDEFSKRYSAIVMLITLACFIFAAVFHDFRLLGFGTVLMICTWPLALGEKVLKHVDEAEKGYPADFAEMAPNALNRRGQ